MADLRDKGLQRDRCSRHKLDKVNEVDRADDVDDIDEDDEDLVVQIVTNAKHVEEGDIVAVAKEEAIVPAGAEPESDGGEGIEVKKTTVGGVQSAGMLCDGVMLSWPAGTAGVLAKFNEFEEHFPVGGAPPLIKPRK